MELKLKYRNQIKKSNRLKALLAAEFNKTTMTIERWCDTGDAMLTTARALSIISLELKVSEHTLLTEKIEA